jgi:hypothetical protein
MVSPLAPKFQYPETPKTQIGFSLTIDTPGFLVLLIPMSSLQSETLIPVTYIALMFLVVVPVLRAKRTVCRLGDCSYPTFADRQRGTWYILESARFRGRLEYLDRLASVCQSARTRNSTLYQPVLRNPSPYLYGMRALWLTQLLSKIVGVCEYNIAL